MVGGNSADPASRVLNSAKYRRLDPSFVERMVGGADGTDALRLARRRLHQVYGAFLRGNPARAIDRACAEVTSSPDRHPEAWRTAMMSHASTAERAPHLEEFGRVVGEWCGRPASVIDLAGGLGALSAPWLDLGEGATWEAVDVDRGVADALNRIGVLLGTRVHGRCEDLVTASTRYRAEVVLLLKAVTTLEAQGAGSSARLIGRTECDHLIISLPGASLGGRRRYGADPLNTAHAALESTTYRVADEAVVGGEHLLLCRPAEPRGEGLRG